MRELTGKYRIYKSFWGWSIRVEHLVYKADFEGDDSPPVKVWSRAKLQDLIELKLA